MAPLFVLLLIIYSRFSATIGICSLFSLKLPAVLETLEGSCIVIPCSFSIPDDYNLGIPATGLWSKHSRWAKTENILNVEILGQLTHKNCTTVLYNVTRAMEDQYFFRIETGFKFTFNEHVTIKTRDVLPKPRVTPPSRQQEGSTIRVACSVASPCPQSPPTLTWRPALGDSVVTIQKKEDGTQEVSSVLSFISSSVHNGVDLSCVVSSSDTRVAVQETIRLSVDYCPKNVSVSVTPAEWLLGSDVTLSCFSDAHPAVESYWWFWENGNHSELVGQAADLNLNLTLRTMGRYWCRVQNRLGEANSTVVELRIPGSDVQEVLRTDPLWWVLAGGLSLLLVASFCLICRCRRKQHKNGTKTGPTSTEGVTDPGAERRRPAPRFPEDSLYANMPSRHKTKTRNKQEPETSNDGNIYGNL
ncbi:myelin-associated glycoprotein-like [Denticeps clupeoides]|uniref:myelin-associated glycoprotein-like n=1 Tax=Denticeps clupeoides TaxID=299321 RepID=UPI0010A55AD8|nr:myelin-associated glycoprotein-like [Denticeps clupeoides]